MKAATYDNLLMLRSLSISHLQDVKLKFAVSRGSDDAIEPLGSIMDCSDQAQSKDLGQVDGSEQPTLDLAKQIMYDAMIADLGTIRMNTLPLEDGSHNYTIPLNVVKQPVPTDQTLAWHSKSLCYFQIKS
jgi:hypothetical protein